MNQEYCIKFLKYIDVSEQISSVDDKTSKMKHNQEKCHIPLRNLFREHQHINGDKIIIDNLIQTSSPVVQCPPPPVKYNQTIVDNSIQMSSPVVLQECNGFQLICDAISMPNLCNESIRETNDLALICDTISKMTQRHETIRDCNGL